MENLPTFGITHPFITSATGLDVAQGMALDLVTEIVSDLEEYDVKEGANIAIPVLVLRPHPEDMLQVYRMQPSILTAANSAVTAYNCTIVSAIPYVAHGISEASEEGVLKQDTHGARTAIGWRLRIVKNPIFASLASKVDGDGDPMAVLAWRQLMDEALAEVMDK